ncbi:MAG: hypothetical protein COV73_02905 [Candidatus Omnitrophica bacterium CG11_big_fil_rev_8_21_14_0_20_43_6]|nr:MAG: hypothetical protein COV73_02905 [Candidatus Omnitrophica bacterium CG11_big_fil_rev_8_21_14_0_20_43_6]
MGFPGRFEEVEKGVILDGAHNPQKIKALINFLRKCRVQSAECKVILVIGFKKGKKWEEMVDLLVNEFRNKNKYLGEPHGGWSNWFEKEEFVEAAYTLGVIPVDLPVEKAQNIQEILKEVGQQVTREYAREARKQRERPETDKDCSPGSAAPLAEAPMKGKPVYTIALPSAAIFGYIFGALPGWLALAFIIIGLAAPMLIERSASGRRAAKKIKTSPISLLNADELTAISFIAKDMTNAEIAGEMHYSESYIGNVVSRIYRKLGVGNRREVALMAISGKRVDVKEIRKYYSEKINAHIFRLTAREITLMMTLANGWWDNKLMEEVNLSQGALKNIISSIGIKLGIKGKVGVTMVAILIFPRILAILTKGYEVNTIIREFRLSSLDLPAFINFMKALNIKGIAVNVKGMAELEVTVDNCEITKIRLTELEKEVLRIIARGFENREIGAKLVEKGYPEYAEKIVAKIRRGIYFKLNVANSTAAVIKGVRIGIVTKEEILTDLLSLAGATGEDVSSIQSFIRKNLSSLAKREKRAMLLLINGADNRGINRALNVVYAHNLISGILNKLGAKNRTHAAAICLLFSEKQSPGGNLDLAHEAAAICGKSHPESTRIGKEVAKKIETSSILSKIRDLIRALESSSDKISDHKRKEIISTICNIVRNEPMAQNALEEAVSEFIFGSDSDNWTGRGIRFLSKSWFNKGAKDNLKTRMPTFVDILNDKYKLGRFLLVLTILRAIYSAREINNKPFAPIEYAQRTGRQIRLRELFIVSISESFRRHIIYTSDSQGRIYAVEVKIPGEIRIPGRERWFVSSQNFDIAKEMWERSPVDPGTVKPLFVYSLKGNFSLYNWQRDFDNPEPLNIIGFEYEDGKRLDHVKNTFLARISHKTGRAIEEINCSLIIDKAVSAIRLHHLKYYGARDMNLGNLRLLLDGRLVYVGDFGGFEHQPKGLLPIVRRLDMVNIHMPIRISDATLLEIIFRLIKDIEDVALRAELALETILDLDRYIDDPELSQLCRGLRKIADGVLGARDIYAPDSGLGEVIWNMVVYRQQHAYPFSVTLKAQQEAEQRFDERWTSGAFTLKDLQDKHLLEGVSVEQAAVFLGRLNELLAAITKTGPPEAAAKFKKTLPKTRFYLTNDAANLGQDIQSGLPFIASAKIETKQAYFHVIGFFNQTPAKQLEVIYHEADSHIVKGLIDSNGEAMRDTQNFWYPFILKQIKKYAAEGKYANAIAICHPIIKELGKLIYSLGHEGRMDETKEFCKILSRIYKIMRDYKLFTYQDTTNKCTFPATPLVNLKTSEAQRLKKAMQKKGIKKGDRVLVITGVGEKTLAILEFYYENIIQSGGNPVFIIGDPKTINEFMPQSEHYDVLLDLRKSNAPAVAFTQIARIDRELAHSAAQTVANLMQAKSKDVVMLMPNFGDAEALSIAMSLYDAARAAARPIIIMQPIKHTGEIIDDPLRGVLERVALRPQGAAPVIFAFLHKDRFGHDIKTENDAGYKERVLGDRNSRMSLDEFAIKKKKAFEVSGPGINREVFLQAGRADYEGIRRRSKALLAKHKKRKIRMAEIVDCEENRLVVDIAGRRFIDDIDVQVSVDGDINMPGGELLSSPTKYSRLTHGILKINHVIDVLGGWSIYPDEPIYLTIKNGFIVGIKGGMAAKIIKDSIAYSRARVYQLLKEGKITTELAEEWLRNASHIGEFAIGLDGNAILIVNLLGDEKIGGTIHIAIGANYSQGENYADALTHFDLIAEGATVIFHYMDGSQETILRDGKFVMQDTIEDEAVAPQAQNLNLVISAKSPSLEDRCKFAIRMIEEAKINGLSIDDRKALKKFPKAGLDYGTYGATDLKIFAKYFVPRLNLDCETAAQLKVLDAGSGIGTVVLFLALVFNMQAYGIEIDKEKFAIAEKLRLYLEEKGYLRPGQVRFINADLKNAEFSQFDLVYYVSPILVEGLDNAVFKKAIEELPDGGRIVAVFASDFSDPRLKTTRMAQEQTSFAYVDYAVIYTKTFSHEFAENQGLPHKQARVLKNQLQVFVVLGQMYCGALEDLRKMIPGYQGLNDLRFYRSGLSFKQHEEIRYFINEHLSNDYHKLQNALVALSYLWMVISALKRLEQSGINELRVYIQRKEDAVKRVIAKHLGLSPEALAVYLAEDAAAVKMVIERLEVSPITPERLKVIFTQESLRRHKEGEPNLISPFRQGKVAEPDQIILAIRRFYAAKRFLDRYALMVVRSLPRSDLPRGAVDAQQPPIWRDEDLLALEHLQTIQGILRSLITSSLEGLSCSLDSLENALSCYVPGQYQTLAQEVNWADLRLIFTSQASINQERLKRLERLIAKTKTLAQTLANPYLLSHPAAEANYWLAFLRKVLTALRYLQSKGPQVLNNYLMKKSVQVENKSSQELMKAMGAEGLEALSWLIKHKVNHLKVRRLAGLLGRLKDYRPGPFVIVVELAHTADILMKTVSRDYRMADIFNLTAQKRAALVTQFKEKNLDIIFISAKLRNEISISLKEMEYVLCVEKSRNWQVFLHKAGVENEQDILGVDQELKQLLLFGSKN